MAGGLNEGMFKVPFNQGHSMILWKTISIKQSSSQADILHQLTVLFDKWCCLVAIDLSNPLLCFSDRTILVDVALPPLRGLYILGTLEFPSSSSNVLSAACVVVLGGVLRVGEWTADLWDAWGLFLLLIGKKTVENNLECHHDHGVQPNAPGYLEICTLDTQNPCEEWWLSTGANYLFLK